MAVAHLLLLMLLQSLISGASVATSYTSNTTELVDIPGLSWTPPGAESRFVSGDQAIVHDYVDCNSHDWQRASAFIIAQGTQKLSTIVPSTVILRPYGKGPANRVFCYENDGIWVQNWAPDSWELDLSVVADKVSNILKTCCGSVCTDTDVLNTKDVRGVFVELDGKNYGVGVAHLPDGQTCENTPP